MPLKVAAVVLARGGSKGIPLKNVTDLSGKPLLGWALDALRDVSGFSSVWVSTDNQKIADCAVEYGGNVHWRSAETAVDQASSVEAIQEFVRSHPEFDAIANIQCTSPMIQPQFLDEALSLLQDGYDSVFAVRRSHGPRWTVDKDKKLVPLNFDPQNRRRRQDWDGELVEIGMFYIARVHLIERGLFQGGRLTFVEIPKAYSIDVDEPFDLDIARHLVTKYGYRRAEK